MMLCVKVQVRSLHAQMTAQQAGLQASEEKSSKQPEEASSTASKATLRAAQSDLNHLVRSFNSLSKIIMRSRGYENDDCAILDSCTLCTHQSSIRISEDAPHKV